MYTNEMGNNLLIGCSVHALLVGGAGAGATGWSLCGWLCRVLKTGKNWLEYIIQLCIYSWGLVAVDTLWQLNFAATPIVFLRIYLQSRSYRLGPTDRRQEEEGQDFRTTAESQQNPRSALFGRSSLIILALVVFFHGYAGHIFNFGPPKVSV